MAKGQNKVENYKKKQKETGTSPEIVRSALAASLGSNFKDMVAIHQKHVERALALINPGLQQAQAFLERNRGTFDQAQRMQLEMQKVYRDILKPLLVNKTEVHYLPPSNRPGFFRSDADIDVLAERVAKIFMKKIKASNGNRIPLTLTNEGDLFRTGDRSKFYSMRKSAIRVNILRYLLGFDTFVASKTIQAATGCASYKTLTGAIGIINDKARSKLKLSKGIGNRLIISKPYCGYMINPLYAVAEE